MAIADYSVANYDRFAGMFGVSIDLFITYFARYSIKNTIRQKGTETERDVQQRFCCWSVLKFFEKKNAREIVKWSKIF